MIHLVAGATVGYPWAEAYWQSVLKYAEASNTRFEPMAVTSGHDWEERKARAFMNVRPYWFDFREDIPWSYMNISASPPFPSQRFEVGIPPNRCKCMQAGDFLDYIHYLHRDVIIHTDADMVMQRSFTEEELISFVSLAPGEVLVGINGHEGATLLEEAELLVGHKGKSMEWALFDKLLPDWQELPVWNTGVMIAQAQTWKRLRDLTRGVLPVCETMFPHYAALQFAISYTIGRWMKAAKLSQVVHVHGHFGLPNNATWTPAGEVGINCEDGWRLAAFRHCLNLTPEKGAKP